MKGSVNVYEERSEGKRAHKTIDDFGFELFSVDSYQLRSYKAMNVFFSDGFGDKFRVLFFTRLVIIKRVNKFLVRGSILNLIDSAIEWIILNADQGLLSESVSIDNFE